VELQLRREALCRKEAGKRLTVASPPVVRPGSTGNIVAAG
jgi:hypothetical protein